MQLGDKLFFAPAKRKDQIALYKRKLSLIFSFRTILTDGFGQEKILK